MKRKKIDVTDYANVITKALPKGILLTTKVNDLVNSMIIGWGTLGTNWGVPVFAAYVREGRYSREILDENPEFTVSIPLGEMDEKIFRVCSSMSGRDTDKIREAGLTLVDAEVISVPAVKEVPLTLECKVLYEQKQDLSELSEDIIRDFYPPNVSSRTTGANHDAHITFFGQIVAAYIIED